MTRYSPTKLPKKGSIVEVSAISEMTSAIARTIDYKFNKMRGFVLPQYRIQPVYDRFKNVMPVYLFDTGTIELIPAVFLTGEDV